MYKKKHTTIRRLFTLALALIMVLVTGLSLAVPARAAGENEYKAPFQITIKTNGNVSTPPAGTPADDGLVTRFWAYQIFIGEISSNSYQGGGYQGGTDPSAPGAGQDIVSPKANQLADVKWGASIEDKAGLLSALEGDTTLAKDAGVTYQLLVLAGKAYLETENAHLKSFAAAYNNIANWDEETVGGTMTSDGKTAIESAFAQITLGDLYTVRIGSASTEDAAALVAKVLSDFTTVSGNAALAQAFTDIVTDKNGDNYKYLKNSGGDAKGKPSSSNKDYGGAYAVSKWTSGSDIDGSYWTIGDSGDSNTDKANLLGGYYLIRDTYSEKGNKDKANSEYIVAVFGNSTIYPKADIPTADKTIVGAPEPGKGDSFEIGKEITFQVKGTLPEDYDTAYEKYFYSFTDTMDVGLEYLGGGKTANKTIKTEGNSAGTATALKDILRMYVKVPNANEGVFGDDGSKYDYYLVELDSGSTYDYTDTGYDSYTGNGYWLNVTENANGNQTKIEITIPDLKKLKGKKVIAADPWNTGESLQVELKAYITHSSEIYVEYTAALNENAVVNSPNGNMNSVDLEYSNNPNWQGTGKPDTGTTETESKTHVYDFGVAINKYDGSKGDYSKDDPGKNVMEGVGFALTKCGEWYPYFTSNNDTAAAGWISKTDVLAYLAHFGIDEDKAADYLNGTKALPTGDDEGMSPIPAAGNFLASGGANAPTVKDEMTAYALLKKVNGSSPDKDHYTIAGWIPEVELKSVLDVATDTITDNDWVKSIAGTKVVKYLGAGFGSSVTDTFFLTIQTDSDGYLRIEGMGSGIEYSLVEVVTPSGYDTIDPISVEFKAEYNDDGTLKNAARNVNNEGDKSIYETIDGRSGWVEGYSELIVTNAVPNYPSGYLPGTGGMGTTLFYIAGIALLTGAALFLIFSNVRKKRGQRAR